MAKPGLFFVYFRPFLIQITISTIQIEKSIDGVLAIRTRGRRMVGTDETTELWRPPMVLLLPDKFPLNISQDNKTCSNKKRPMAETRKLFAIIYGAIKVTRKNLLVERSLPTPEICGSNPVNCQLYRKYEIKEKSCREWPIIKKCVQIYILECS